MYAQDEGLLLRPIQHGHAEDPTSRALPHAVHRASLERNTLSGLAKPSEAGSTAGPLRSILAVKSNDHSGKTTVFASAIVILCTNCEQPDRTPTIQCEDCGDDKTSSVVFCTVCDEGMYTRRHARHCVVDPDMSRLLHLLYSVTSPLSTLTSAGDVSRQVSTSRRKCASISGYHLYHPPAVACCARHSSRMPTVPRMQTKHAPLYICQARTPSQWQQREHAEGRSLIRCPPVTSARLLLPSSAVVAIAAMAMLQHHHSPLARTPLMRNTTTIEALTRMTLPYRWLEGHRLPCSMERFNNVRLSNRAFCLLCTPFLFDVLTRSLFSQSVL